MLPLKLTIILVTFELDFELHFIFHWRYYQGNLIKFEFS